MTTREPVEKRAISVPGGAISVRALTFNEILRIYVENSEAIEGLYARDWSPDGADLFEEIFSNHPNIVHLIASIASDGKVDGVWRSLTIDAQSEIIEATIAMCVADHVPRKGVKASTGKPTEKPASAWAWVHSIREMVSEIMSCGHADAADYTLPTIKAEYELAQIRQARAMAIEASLFQLAYAGARDKKAGKEFQKTIKEMMR